MHTVNLAQYGHLVNGEYFTITRTNPEFYMLLWNRENWERRYLHPEYAELLKPNATYNQPCPDVYWMPIVTERFCDELVELLEAYGHWKSSVAYNDPVPTQDIQLFLVKLEDKIAGRLCIYRNCSV